MLIFKFLKNIGMCVCVYVFMWMQLPVEARRGHQIPQSWNYKQVKHHQKWMLETKLESSVKVVQSCKWWAISHPQYVLLVENIKVAKKHACAHTCMWASEKQAEVWKGGGPHWKEAVTLQGACNCAIQSRGVECKALCLLASHKGPCTHGTMHGCFVLPV